MRRTSLRTTKFIQRTAATMAIFTLQAVSFAQAGHAIAWGRNTSGETDLPPMLGVVRQIATGGDWHGGYTTSLRIDGSIATWGNNTYQIANTPPDLGACRAISAGWYHIMALTESRQVRAWGYVGAGAFWTVPSDLGACESIAAGYLHSLALQVVGTVRGWGNNDYGGPVSIPSNLGPCRAIGASYYYSTAIRLDGVVRSWGSNESGQLDIPVSLGACVSVSAGAGHQLVLQSDGQVHAWGANLHGQCDVPTDLGGCVQIAAGLYHSVALDIAGKVHAWGMNTDGQATVPATLGTATSIAAGGYQSAAIEADAQILGVQPISGPADGGTRVVITGRHFKPSSRVAFNGTEATQVAVESDTRISATTPVGVPGEAVVTVDHGEASAFYYRPYCGSDLDQNGFVDGGDMAILLLDWGPCTNTAYAGASDEPPALLQSNPRRP